jgi:hypothetical protein
MIYCTRAIWGSQNRNLAAVELKTLLPFCYPFGVSFLLMVAGVKQEQLCRDVQGSMYTNPSGKSIVISAHVEWSACKTAGS